MGSCPATKICHELKGCCRAAKYAQSEVAGTSPFLRILLEDVLRAHVQVHLRGREVVVAEDALERDKGDTAPDRIDREGVA